MELSLRGKYRAIGIFGGFLGMDAAVYPVGSWTGWLAAILGISTIGAAGIGYYDDVVKPTRTS